MTVLQDIKMPVPLYHAFQSGLIYMNRCCNYDLMQIYGKQADWYEVED